MRTRSTCSTRSTSSMSNGMDPRSTCSTRYAQWLLLIFQSLFVSMQFTSFSSSRTSSSQFSSHHSPGPADSRVWGVPRVHIIFPVAQIHIICSNSIASHHFPCPTDSPHFPVRFMSSFLSNILQKIADSNVVNFDWIGYVDEIGIKKNYPPCQRIGIRHCQQ
jgi:hypothetical protein